MNNRGVICQHDESGTTILKRLAHLSGGAEHLTMPSDKLLDRYEDVAATEAAADLFYLVHNPEAHCRVRGFVSGEDYGWHALNEPRGEPDWTIAWRTSHPLSIHYWFFYGEPAPDPDKPMPDTLERSDLYLTVRITTPELQPMALYLDFPDKRDLPAGFGGEP